MNKWKLLAILLVFVVCLLILNGCLHVDIGNMRR